jgi:hypothetical protein
MSDKPKDLLDSILNEVEPTRRDFLRRLLAGGGALTLIGLPASNIVADPAQQATQEKGKTGKAGKAKGKAKGDAGTDSKGKAKGAAKGKAKGQK